MPPRTAIIVLNWNGWRDTIECLESLLGLRGADYRIIVCDNGSSDDSIKHIDAWARGALPSDRAGPPWQKLPGGVAPKPIPCRRISRQDALLDGPRHPGLLLTLIDIGANLGFAGGNNVGLRYAQRRKEFTHYWLLNNDTVVHPNALAALQWRVDNDPRIGLCGSRIMSYHEPERLQAAGGSTYDWNRALSSAIIADSNDVALVEGKLDYVSGASMLLTDRFLEIIGFMTEDYFLYFEEMDWAKRAAGRFRLGYAPESIIYHKEGASIGSSSTQRPSDLSLRYITRNRLLFTARFASECRINVRFQLLLEALVYVKRRDWSAVVIILRALAQDLISRASPQSAHNQQ